jgi:hypothetical protein
MNWYEIAIRLIPPKPLTRLFGEITTQAEASSIQSKSTQANAPHYIVYYKVQLTYCRPARQATGRPCVAIISDADIWMTNYPDLSLG